MKILFAGQVAELFEQLPAAIKRKAAQSIDLLSAQPLMYPVRRRGVLRGYRYFVAGHTLFYYSVSADEVRILAILDGRMKRA